MTVSPDATVEAAAKLMLERGISGLMVVDAKGELAGVVTEGDLLRRDERDSRRTAAPLKAAPDAHLLDTTHLGIDAAFRAAVDIIEAVRAGRKRR